MPWTLSSNPKLALVPLSLLAFAGVQMTQGADILSQPGLFPQLTEPPCWYCSTENRKGFIKADDRVIAWMRAVHNGGAIPMRIFLGQNRIINDTYGLFFHDADGGYVTAYRKDYGYTFEGWRKGVMIVRSRDGTFWSALSGRAIDGPQKGTRLERIPSCVTDWGYWLMLHPESTTYNLFDGRNYQSGSWPSEPGADAQQSMGPVDSRLPANAPVLGVEIGRRTEVFPLDGLKERACFMEELDGKAFAVIWYGLTHTATAFEAEHNGQKLTLYADDISPETAPFKDKETGTRWSIAGRGIDGPLRGVELTWVPSVQCRWYAWSAEYPETLVFSRH